MGKTMQLVEQTVIKQSDVRYSSIDRAAFASKNLYNAALYELRQSFIFQKIYLSYETMDRRMKSHEAYKALPAKVAQQVLRLLDKNWKAFFASMDAWRKDSSSFQGRPKLPKYKEKEHGRNVLIYTAQAVSKKGLKEGCIRLSGLPISIPTKQQHIDQVRVVPHHGFSVVEVVYTKEPVPADVDPALYAGIDIGLNNLATLTSNKPGFLPRIVNGRPVKSINQFYNKERARLQSQLRGNCCTSQHLERLTNKRTRKIDHYLHMASKHIIALLVQEGIGTLVIGKNAEWKQTCHMGKRTNQNFVQVPHARFIDMLTYKATFVGIQVKITEESYTSQASFLDGDPIPVYGEEKETRPVFRGKRIKRGLYRASSGRHMNADVNGSYNIIRKVAPKIFKGVEDVVVHPVLLALGA
jgi:putative transposase